MMQNNKRRSSDHPFTLKVLAGCVALALVGFLCPTVHGYADDQLAQPSDQKEATENEPVASDGTAKPSTDPRSELELPAAPDAGGLPQGEAANDADSVGNADDDKAKSESGPDEAAAFDAEESTDASVLAEPDEDPVRSFAGATMYETAVAEAKAAYPQGTESAIIVGPGDAWIDALSATGLAASKGPILFTERDSLHSATKQALKELGVKSVVIIGGSAAVSAKAEQAIVGEGIKVEARLGGSDCFDTQMKIYEYGRTNKLWDASMAIVATASHFGDALSVSPVAFAKKAPIFLVASEGQLRQAQQQALVQGAREGGYTSIVIVGGPAAVSSQVEGFASGLTYWNGGLCIRLAGATQYETSAEIAAWATSSQGLSWDRLAFATGKAPYDALAGSVLQGSSKSVLLLADGTNTATLNAAEQHKGSISHVRIFGGTAAVPQALRDAIISKLGVSTAAKPKEAAVLEGSSAVVEATDVKASEKPNAPEAPGVFASADDSSASDASDASAVDSADAEGAVSGASTASAVPDSQEGARASETSAANSKDAA